MDALDRKINEVFPGKVVRKDLTALLRRGANVPTFVLEYLLGMYCATDDETAIAEGVEKIRKILAENYVRPEESEKVKSLIRERGEYTVIDKVSAVLDEYKDIYVARFSNLEIEPFVLQSDYAVKYTKILIGGIWCIARIGYTYQQDSMEDEKKQPQKRGPEDSPFRILASSRSAPQPRRGGDDRPSGRNLPPRNGRDAAPLGGHGAGRAERKRKAAFHRAHGAAGRAQLQPLRARPARHGQEPSV